jgi:release factor glutamine methyltransferase
MATYQHIQQQYQQQLIHLYDKNETDALLKIAISAKHPAFLNLHHTISPVLEEQMLAILNELATGKPIQQILGKAHFYHLDFLVSEHVLIPRPETEELIYMIIQNHKDKFVSVLDIGTGSGCIPIALKKNMPGATVATMDVSKEALDIARQNAALHQVEIEFINDSALDLSSERYPKYDVMVSNPPYIKLEEKAHMHKNVLDFEPHLALFVDNDQPLIFYDRIADFALTNLKPTGSLYFEINQYLAAETRDLLFSKGFWVEVIKDINGNDRFIRAGFK